MIEVEQPVPVIFLAGRRFLQQFLRRFDDVREVRPRFRQDGIFDCHLISKIVFRRQPEPLNDMQLVGIMGPPSPTPVTYRVAGYGVGVGLPKFGMPVGGTYGGPEP